MSRRQSRDSDLKRQRSRFDRQPSPKRSRRDGKPEVERVLGKNDLDVKDGTDLENQRHQHLQDAASLEHDTHALSKDAEKRHDVQHSMTKQTPSLSEIPRSRSYYQHDDRGSAGRGDRRAIAGREWWRGARDQINRRAIADERSQRRNYGDKSMGRHDKFRENEDNQDPPTRKRPAFREKKVQEDLGHKDRTGTEQAKEINHDRRDVGSERKEERERRNTWHSERHERVLVGRDRERSKGERFDDRAGGGGRQSYKADYRDRFNNGRQGIQGSGFKDEKKWEHDLFDEANKSPPRKNEEEQIAKLEALLSS